MEKTMQNSGVTLWQVPLEIGEAEREELGYTLSKEERERATRFRFDRDRSRFIACRGRLRLLLGRTLGLAPARIAFDIGPYGKPQLHGAKRDLRFNLSHSGDLALIALTSGCEVGVDLEQLRQDFDPMQLAEGRFAPSELATLRATPEHRRHARFLQIWTAKEACLKAIGQGLSGGLARFPVPLCGKAQFPLELFPETSLNEAVRCGRLSLMPLRLEGNCLAALAIQGPMLPLLLRHWNQDESLT